VEVSGEQLVIGMNKAGELTLARGSGASQPLTREQLEANLREEGKAHPDRAVFVQADGALAYQEVMDLLELAKQSGIPRVGLVTRPASEP
jgi:biopolymer transport protein TolR